MADLGTYYVQVVPSAKGIKGSLTKAMDGEAASAGSSAGSSIAGGIKSAIVGAGIGAAVGMALKSAISEAGDLEQSFGGLDTIYGDAADAAKKYAAEAAKAGISANAYAEQAVSFGAGLKQAFEGDTSKAVKAANTAIMDMTDNAAKMGTPIENIQNAYQGFAKQNYTMLDNLKLGYGGTKTEMERLLADATKISGVEYNIDNLGDVYDAIHVVQGELGLTGVAAQEASTTLSGSFGAMKASLSNFLASLALGEDIKTPLQNLISSTGAYLFDNLLPAIGNVILALPDVVQTSIRTVGPTVMTKGSEIIDMIISGLNSEVPAFISTLPQILQTGLDTITQNLPTVLSTGREIITNLVMGAIENIPVLISGLNTIFNQLVDFLISNLPTIAEEGGKLAEQLGAGIVKNLPAVLGAVKTLGVSIVKGVIKLAPQVLKAAGRIAMGIAKGFGGSALNAIRTALGKIKDAITKPIKDAKETVEGFIKKITGFFPIKLGNVFSGLKLPRFKLLSKGKIPFGVLGKGSLPKWDVDFYRKAENDPYMFQNATLFGAGEHNDEILYGRRRLMKDIEAATASEGSGDIVVNLNYDASDDAAEMLRDLARGVRRYRMAGVF